jgi:hypothetical protein
MLYHLLEAQDQLALEPVLYQALAQGPELASLLSALELVLLVLALQTAQVLLVVALSVLSSHWSKSAPVHWW